MEDQRIRRDKIDRELHKFIYKMRLEEQNNKKRIEKINLKRKPLTEKQKKSLEPLEQKILKKVKKNIENNRQEYLKLINNNDTKTFILTLTVLDIQNMMKCSKPTARKYLFYLYKKNNQLYKFIENGKKGAGYLQKLGIVLQKLPRELLI